MKKFVVILIVLLLGGAIGWWLKSPQETTPQASVSSAPSPDATLTEASPSLEPSTEPSPVASGQTVTGTKEFVVSGIDFSFTPNTMKVNMGDTVKVTFKDTSGVHDFRLDEFKVATKVLAGGKEETVEFVADKKGSFEYYCSIGNHRKMGMKGTLVVE